MKLIYCPECNDVVRLYFAERMCRCGKSSGKYVDDLNAEYIGSAIPLGFDNRSFVTALRNRRNEGMGYPFEAFVIPVECDTMKKITQ